jgi:23S rRNA pseudouridine1911/1915/1917 synthase
MHTEEWEDEELDEIEGDKEAAPEIQERARMIVDKGQSPERVDKYIMSHVEGTTRSKVQQAIEDGMVLVDGKPTKANVKVRPNMEIVYLETRRPERTDIIPEPMDLVIVYEDEDVMVVNKPPGMVVHPGCGNYSGTLVNGVAWHLNPESDKQRIIELPRIGLVHRIDKDTSGLVLLGKTQEAIEHLSAQFRKHSIHRRYVALAWGHFEQTEGTITAHIGRNLRFRKKMDAYPDGEHGKHAVTHYKVLEQFHYVSLLEYRLETGRTHQIRVHSKLIGHPLFNDETYGGDRIVKGTIYTKYKQFVENCFRLLPRQALHARELGFVHPRTGEEMRFEAPIPDDMQSVIDKWRRYIVQE